MLRLTLFVLCTLTNTSGLSGQDLEQYSFSRPAMGTQLNIILYTTTAHKANEVAQAVFERVDHLNSVFSDYDPESEVNLLCQKSQSNTWVQVSDDLFDLLHLSKKISKSTQGSFDVTLGKYTRLWRQSRKEKKLPSVDKLIDRKAFGYQNIRLRAKDKSVKIKNPEILIDFGGIAKGYTAQQLLMLLKQNHIQQALVDFGGDITTSAAPPNKTGWHIEVNYSEGEGEVSEILSVQDLSVATSGDRYQKIKANDNTYSHIIDPTTGLGITKPVQVTVIAKSGALADSYATAFNVMGLERIKKFLRKPKNQNVHTLVSYVENNILKVWKSPKFDTFKAAHQ
ncbi:FAD:protein FMN transferase [Flagellimonas iocasae]|uniref:FAD:protein FMN transferase n=1 Tax=Flagellimonas iocasae TaxID=2055905 RepID=A0ABW4Y2L4_9FLAO